MRTMLSVGTLLAVSLGAATLASAQQPPAGAQSPPPTPAVKVGDAAPDFTLPYRPPTKPGGKLERREVRLSDFKGKQNVVLAFFVAAFSPG
jgi:hypothetical protein